MRHSSLSLAFFSLCLLLVPASTYADVVLPKALVEYVQQHPGATPDEIRQFMQRDSSTNAANTKDQETFLQLTRSQSKISLWQTCLQFFILGIKHILSAPDHIFRRLSLED